MSTYPGCAYIDDAFVSIECNRLTNFPNRLNQNPKDIQFTLEKKDKELWSLVCQRSIISWHLPTPGRFHFTLQKVIS